MGVVFDNRLHCCDCIDGMLELEAGSVDAVVTDPPWPGVKDDLGWLGREWWGRVVGEMERVVGDRGKIIIVVGSETDPREIVTAFRLPFVHQGFLSFMPPRYHGNVMNCGNVFYEFGFGFLPRGSRVMGQTCESVSVGCNIVAWHPTPLARAHVDWLVRSQVGPGRRVLDPFAGSGRIGIAAVTHGCPFLGFELEADYVARANEELEATERGLTVAEARAGQGLMFRT